MQKTTNNSRSVTLKAESTPLWSFSDPEEDLAITPAPLNRAQLDTTTEQHDDLSTEWQGDEQEPAHDCYPPVGAIGRGVVENPGVQLPAQLFTQSSESPDTSTRLAEKVPLLGCNAWIISAPVIERAIQSLAATLYRTPTDTEIAQQLHISVAGYHQALGFLKDIEREIGIQEQGRSKNSGGTELMCLRDAPDSAVFLCMRSEMLKLFRNAVSSLPVRERLVITLRYCEDLGDKDISLVLDIAESAVTRLSASALLHLRARVFGDHEVDHYAFRDDIRPAESKHIGGSKQTGPTAHVYMFGGQSGWLPAGYFWERLGPDATYDHFFQTWLFISDEGELKQVRRLERASLNLNDLRSQSDS